MRWVVVLVLTLVPRDAAALEISEPGMYYQCPGGKTWDEVAKCLKKHGRPEILKSLLGAKLVRLDQKEDSQWVDGGVYLPNVKLNQPLQAECEHFLDCVEKDQRPQSDGRNGLAVVLALEAATRSMRDGSRVTAIEEA